LETPMAIAIFYSMNEARNFMKTFRNLSKLDKRPTSQKSAVGQDF